MCDPPSVAQRNRRAQLRFSPLNTPMADGPSRPLDWLRRRIGNPNELEAAHILQQRDSHHMTKA